MFRTVSQVDEAEKRDEGKKIVEELGALKYELQHDRQLVPIRDDGYDDVALYNAELEKLGNRTWFNIPWLFCECYLYR
jgi:damage-control phosphatase, subfamily III